MSSNKYVLLFYDVQTRFLGAMRSDFEISSTRASLPLHVGSATRIGSSANVEPELVFIIPPGMTNASFEQALCVNYDQDFAKILIVNSGRLPLSLPACVGTIGGNLGSAARFTSTYLVIENWSHLPSTLTTLSCQYCSFGKGEGGDVNNDGWDSDGMVSWSEVFTRMPNLAQIALTNSVLPASLPASLPETIESLDLTSCGLTGSISSTFLTGSIVPSLLLLLQNNKISGTLPSNLLAPLQSNALLTDLTLWLNNNNINGSIPDGLFDPLNGSPLNTFNVRLDGNRGLSGSMPSDLITFSGIDTLDFNLRLDNTNISGPIPEGFFSRFASTGTVEFYASGTQITGPLPNNLFGANWLPTGFVTLDLRNSKLNGTIPPSFVSGNLQLNQSILGLDLLLSNNELEGSIPSNLLWNEVVVTRKDSSSALKISSHLQSEAAPRASLKVSTRLDLKLDGNRLTGSIPASLISESFNSSFASCSIDLRNNMLNGSISGLLFSSFPQTSSSVKLNAENNRLSGPLPPCPAMTAKIFLQLQNNSLVGSIPLSWEQCKFTQINLDTNAGINGTIPPSFFNSTGITTFSAAQTSLNGDLPSIGTTMSSLILVKTDIDFCSSSSILAVAGFEPSHGGCDVRETSACDCVEVYIPCLPTLNDTCSILVPSEPVVSPSSPVPTEVPTSPPFDMAPEEPLSPPIIPTTPSSVPSTEPEDAPTSSSTSIFVTSVLLLQGAVALAALV